MEKLHVGTMGWSYDFWKGNFYPENPQNLLTEYANNFDSVEIDNTFYRIPSKDNVLKWKEETPDENFYGMLRDNKVALTLLDHPWMPRMDTITTDFTYIRWVGDRKKITGTLGKVERDRSEDIKDWAVKIKGFLDNSIDVFGYFSKSYSGYPPGDVRMLLDLFKNDPP
jgi:uncharacterized protein YecE (DUF72 family)